MDQVLIWFAFLQFPSTAICIPQLCGIEPERQCVDCVNDLLAVVKLLFSCIQAVPGMLSSLLLLPPVTCGGLVCTTGQAKHGSQVQSALYLTTCVAAKASRVHTDSIAVADP